MSIRGKKRCVRMARGRSSPAALLSQVASASDQKRTVRVEAIGIFWTVCDERCSCASRMSAVDHEIWGSDVPPSARTASAGATTVYKAR